MRIIDLSSDVGSSDLVLRRQLRRTAAFAFGNPNVAIGKHEGLSGDFEISGDGRDRVALRRHRSLVAPLRRICNLHAGEQPALPVRPLWLRTILRCVRLAAPGGLLGRSGPDSEYARTTTFGPPPRKPEKPKQEAK